MENPDPDIYLSDNHVVVDFETTNLEKGSPVNPDNRIVLATWKRGKGEVKYKFGSEFEQEELIADINSCDFVVAHNAKFELGWLLRCGYDIGSRPVFCTQIADYVLAGNRSWRLSLDDCLIRRGLPVKEDTVKRLIHSGICPSTILSSQLLKYGRLDTALESELYSLQIHELREAGLLPVFFERCLLTPVLADIERRGMQLSPERVDKLYATYTKELDRLNLDMQELTGGINVGSTKQLAVFLYETLGFAIPKDYKGKPMMTPKGAPSTSVDALNSLVPKPDRQDKFLKLYKEINKYSEALSKYLVKFKRCCDDDGGILHASLNQTVTQTHRLSSTGKKYTTQFQNFQRDFKPLFQSRIPDGIFSERDYAQLEYRSAVDISRDPVGMEDIRNGVDSHSITRSIVFKREEAAADGDKARLKELRTMSKSRTFKPLYGGTSGTKEEQEYYKFFLDKHAGIREMQDLWIDEVLQTGKLKTVTGLVFYWPDTAITERGYVTNTTQICNYPNQMFATADIVPIGLVFTWHRMRANNMRSFLVNTVHDSQLAELFPDEVELYEEVAVQSQERDTVEFIKKVFNYQIVVPLETETINAPFWCDSPEWRAKFLGN